MSRLQFLAGLAAAASVAVSGNAVAQPAGASSSPAAASARFGEVRLRIEPGLGEQEAEIKRLLAAYPFVRIGEPADYLVTTDPDFPLDLALIDLRQPIEQWRNFIPGDFSSGTVPRQFAVGNLRSEGTSERLGRILVAASRLRGLLDRSVGDKLGIEACLFIRESSRGWEEGSCQPLAELPDRRIVYDREVGRLRVTNHSGSDRYVSTIAIEGNLRSGWLGQDAEPPVRKIAPGETIDFLPQLAAYTHSDHPRVALLVSALPFEVGEFAQPAPLEANDCSGGRPGQNCVEADAPIAMNDDLALLSFQMTVPEEPQPMMGHGTDVTAAMAVWMAQFYSVVPYTPAEIEADSKLPAEETQFLKLRSYEERQHRCGATLISPNIVLTAAHCVAKGQYAGGGLPKLMKDRRVRLGTRMLGKGGQSFAIAGVAVHGLYDPNKHNHDLALLLLQPDRGSGTVRQQPIAIADRPLPGSTNALGFGWGFTGAVDPKGNIMMTLESRVQDNPEVLQYGEMISVTLDACRRKLAGLVAPGMVCMYSKAALEGRQSAEGVFTCRGDSGGPLVRKIGGRDMLVGVVSWSKGCGFKDYPSVFTDAGSYSQWIAAARAALKPGMAGPVADPARPSTGARRN